jgi:TolB-like protein
LFALCVWLVPARVDAQDTKRVVVQPFTGPSAQEARSHVVNALKDQSGVELAPADDFDGLSGSRLREAASEAGVSAFIEGKVRKKGKALLVTVSVRDAASSEVLHDQDWTRKKTQLSDIRENFWTSMGPYIEKTTVPSKKKGGAAAAVAVTGTAATATAAARTREPPREVEQPRPAPEEREAPPESRAQEPEEEPNEKASASGASSPVHPALVVGLGARMMWRDLSYDGATDLNGYSSYGRDDGSPAFNLALGLQVFPGGFKRSDWLSNLGLELAGDIALGLKSAQGDKEYKTSAFDVGGGLVFRLPYEMFEPQFRAGYVAQQFKIKNSKNLGVPPVLYQSVRLGAGALLRLVEMFELDFAFNFLIVVDTGSLGTKKYAEKLGGYGWEVGGGATVRFKQRYGVRLGAEFRRYTLDTNKSENDDVKLPKGVGDDYLRATLSFVYSLPGVK